MVSAAATQGSFKFQVSRFKSEPVPMSNSRSSRSSRTLDLGVERLCSAHGAPRILVDGYSLSHDWPEQPAGQPRHPAWRARGIGPRARRRYHDATGTLVTIFFDGSGAPAGTPPRESNPAVEVLFSRAGQTADQMIERAAHRFSAYGEVLAVTDDVAERDTVTGMGGLASSCANFIRMVESALTELQDELRNYNRAERNRFNRSHTAQFEMKTRTHQNRMVRRALVLAALLAGTFLAPALRAQPAAPKVDNRFLLIFDTSSDMKRAFAGGAKSAQRPAGDQHERASCIRATALACGRSTRICTRDSFRCNTGSRRTRR